MFIDDGYTREAIIASDTSSFWIAYRPMLARERRRLAGTTVRHAGMKAPPQCRPFPPSSRRISPNGISVTAAARSSRSRRKPSPDSNRRCSSGSMKRLLRSKTKRPPQKTGAGGAARAGRPPSRLPRLHALPEVCVRRSDRTPIRKSAAQRPFRVAPGRSAPTLPNRRRRLPERNARRAAHAHSGQSRGLPPLPRMPGDGSLPRRPHRPP